MCTLPGCGTNWGMKAAASRRSLGRDIGSVCLRMVGLRPRTVEKNSKFLFGASAEWRIAELSPSSREGIVSIHGQEEDKWPKDTAYNEDAPGNRVAKSVASPPPTRAGIPGPGQLWKEGPTQESAGILVTTEGVHHHMEPVIIYLDQPSTPGDLETLYASRKFPGDPLIEFEQITPVLFRVTLAGHTTAMSQKEFKRLLGIRLDCRTH